MSKLTKTYTDNSYTSSTYKKTWTVTYDFNDINITGSTFTVTTPTIKAKFTGTSGTYRYSWVEMDNIALGEVGTWKENHWYDPATVGNNVAGSSGTEFTMTKRTIDPNGDQANPHSWSVNTSTYFNSNNNTVRTLDVSARVYLDMGTDTVKNSGTYKSRYKNTTAFVYTLGTATLNAPPIVTGAAISTSGPVYKNLTPITISIAEATAQYGGDIVSATLTLSNNPDMVPSDSDYATKTFSAGTITNETISCVPTKYSAVVPWLTIEDSRRQTTTVVLDQGVTVRDYGPPSVSYTAQRADLNGKLKDDGTYCLISSDISYYASAVSSLSQPVVAVTDSNGNTVAANITWYSSWSSLNGVSNPITWSGYHPSSPITIYGLMSTSGGFVTETAYITTMTVADSEGSTSSPISQTLPTAFYTMDIQAGGKEISFGGPANDNVSGHLNGLFKCNMDAVFKQEFNVDGDITSGGDIEDGTGNILADKLDALSILNLFYPVGSYYETSNTTFNPNTAWGGTWKLETAGQVHVSAGTGYSVNHADDISGGGTTVGTRDGGEYQITYTPTGSNSAVTLSGEQSGVQAHAHTASASGGKVGSHAHEPSNTDYQFIACEGTSSAAIGRYRIKQGTGSQTEHYFMSSTTSVARYNVTESVAPSFTQPTITVNNATAKNATKSHNHTFTGTQVQLDNMQPYIVVNRWHRTA